LKETNMKAAARAMKFEEPRFIDALALRVRYGGRSEQWVLHQLERNPKFPKPIVIGRRHRLWSVPLLEKYEQQLLEEESKRGKTKRK
jgi:hypothetical protein